MWPQQPSSPYSEQQTKKTVSENKYGSLRGSEALDHDEVTMNSLISVDQSLLGAGSASRRLVVVTDWHELKRCLYRTAKPHRIPSTLLFSARAANGGDGCESQERAAHAGGLLSIVAPKSANFRCRQRGLPRVASGNSSKTSPSSGARSNRLRPPNTRHVGVPVIKQHLVITYAPKVCRSPCSAKWRLVLIVSTPAEFAFDKRVLALQLEALVDDGISSYNHSALPYQKNLPTFNLFAAFQGS